MRILLGMALLFALAWGAPAAGVIIASGDGTQNASPPPDDPGWDHVAALGEFSGVYLGNGWILTANHVGARDAIIGDDVYTAVPGSEIQLENPGISPKADLVLFQIVRDPGLPGVLIRSYPPAPETAVVLIGNGHDRGAFTSACIPSRDGWDWGESRTVRWGTNEVEQPIIDLPLSGTVTRVFRTDFSQSDQTPHEAQATSGDSGGPVFSKSGSVWKLIGIITAGTALGECNSERALYGNLTFSADLSRYRDQIEATIQVPACDDGVDQDGDGLIDYPDDPGCEDWDDPFETSDALPCDDGIDNDGDGGTDFDPATFANPGNETTPPSGEGDLGCGNPTWSTETPSCQDGTDNDGDGKIDYDGGLSAPGDGTTEPDPECIGKPWLNREIASSYRCGLGAELALLLPPLLWQLRRRG